MKPDVMLLWNLTELLIILHVIPPLEIAPRVLLFFQRLKEGFEIAFAKTLRPLALDDFKKESGPVLHWLGKYLEQITFVIAVDQNAESLERLEVLVDVTHAIRQRVVIGRRNIQEFEAALLQVRYRCDNVVRGDRHVLNTFAVVKFVVLFHLRVLLSFGMLI